MIGSFKRLLYTLHQGGAIRILRQEVVKVGVGFHRLIEAIESIKQIQGIPPVDAKVAVDEIPGSGIDL